MKNNTPVNARRAHIVLAPIAISLLLAGCGTFQLASGVFPPSGKTQEQQQLDNLMCKDQAKNEANTAARQAGAFALGFTIVGAPLAYELEKSKQREVYKDCLEARGYRVTPANDARPSTASNSPPSTPAPTQQPKPVKPTVIATTPTLPAAMPTTSGRDEAVQLQKLVELRDKGLISAEEFEKKRKDILDRL